MQTKFREDILLTNAKLEQFYSTLQEILVKIRNEITTELLLDDFFQGKKRTILRRNHTRLKRKPEEVTKEKIIQPLLKWLGFEELGGSSGSFGENRKEVDYVLEVQGVRILIEAEPLNSNLDQNETGKMQLMDYLERKSFRSNLGIATNGTEWILVKFDNKNYKSNEIIRIDITDEINIIRGQKNIFSDSENIFSDSENIKNFYKYFSKDFILINSNDYERILEEKKEEITSKFYEDYIKYVLGYDTKLKQQIDQCLLYTINAPNDSTELEKRLFVITLMSRLIFIRFLEDKGLTIITGRELKKGEESIGQSFLRSLLIAYKSNDIPISFYKSYIQPLFYKVLNVPLKERKYEIKNNRFFSDLPYFNGGLFREVVKNEIDYDVKNDILEIIIQVLEKYYFALNYKENTLNPDILGYVFEKTVNYLTKDTNRQKDLGAYYTPDDVTTYISKETIVPKVFDIIKQVLQEKGWEKHEVDEYTSLNDFLNNPPKNPKTIKEIISKISNITILDPACGSGHFLTSALKELFHLKKMLISLVENNSINYFPIKKEIITNNLFGVDIESSAVEIAKLRLWLSLIEDLPLNNDNRAIESLPNIEYNIEYGNSLLGYTSIKHFDFKDLDILEDNKSSESIFREIDKLKSDFRNIEDPVRLKKIKEDIEQQSKEYNDKLNRLLMTLLNNQYNIKLSFDKIERMEPFHWRLKFNDVFYKNQGFDIIIGNPPYIEKGKLNYPVEHLITKECGNTYAYFFEYSIDLLKPNGFIGFIVPVSSICTPRMEPFQNLLIQNCSLMKISNYDDRPGKIFRGLEHCRQSIIIANKKKDDKENIKILTTKYNRWYSEDRYKLFQNLEFVDSTNLVSRGIIPKLGKGIEVELLRKLRKEPPLSNYLLQKKKNINQLTNQRIWYHAAPQYWIRAMNFIPKYEGNGQDISSKVKTIIVNDPKKRDQIISIMNSSLFYWFFIITADGRDLTEGVINNFNINLDTLNQSNIGLLNGYCSDLMTDLNKHSKLKTQKIKTKDKKTGETIYKIISIQEFYPKFSKHIIDKIDDVLADHYDFTSEQNHFIKTFDEQFRMREDKENIRKDNILN